MKHTEATPVAGTSRPHVLAVYRVVLPRFVHSPALWLLLAAYLLALVIYIPAGGTVPDLLYLFVSGLYDLLIAVLVFPFMAGAPLLPGRSQKTLRAPGSGSCWCWWHSPS